VGDDRDQRIEGRVDDPVLGRDVGAAGPAIAQDEVGEDARVPVERLEARPDVVRRALRRRRLGRAELVQDLATFLQQLAGR
jgi:hypothetical protein